MGPRMAMAKAAVRMMVFDPCSGVTRAGGAAGAAALSGCCDGGSLGDILCCFWFGVCRGLLSRCLFAEVVVLIV
jgi:hypothetical protein